MANPHAGWRAGVVVGSLGVVLGCGAGTPGEPRTPSPAPSIAEPLGPPTTHAPVSSLPAPDAGDLGANQPEVSPATTDENSSAAAKVEPSRVEAECNALCASAAQTCSRKSTRECRANCGKYQSLAERCETQVLGAIRCQAGVPKLVCSNLASECTNEFQALSACEQGEADATPNASPSRLELPPGWQLVRDTEAAFEVALPLGARVGELQGHRTWTAEGPDGAGYRVAILPAVGARASEKRLMQAVFDYLGQQCQPLVRLHGRFETERDVAQRFNARCEDGQRWRGILRASPERLVLVVEVLPPGVQATGDAYYYSFEYLE